MDSPALSIVLNKRLLSGSSGEHAERCLSEVDVIDEVSSVVVFGQHASSYQLPLYQFFFAMNFQILYLVEQGGSP